MPSSTQALRTAWSSTLCLPKASFPARAIAADRPKYLKRCTDDLYQWQNSARTPGHPFVLHDGPPYANGSLHVGHALNKILKDVTLRIRLSWGKRVEYTPGWDCHGLPIELKALQRKKELGHSGDGKRLSPVEIRRAARELAENTVEEQKNAFRQWGIMADWDNAWKTMDKEFEMRQLEVFKKMVEKGLIYRKFKPVYWSPSSHTALAEAELEYKADHLSAAAYIKFHLTDLSPALQDRSQTLSELPNAVIWTTTPWTIPANKAIAVHSELDYVIVKSVTHGSLLVAASRVSEMEKFCGESLLPTDFGIIHGHELVGSMYEHPLLGKDSSASPILHAPFVSAESGSGLVHMAPGHGMEDYKLCEEHGITTSAPVDDYGRFTQDALPSQPEVLMGLEVLGDGNKAVLTHLATCHAIIACHSYRHNYPYDWRSKQPVIIRSTEQWFADVGGIRETALQALDNVAFIPKGSKERLVSFVRNRSEWCISRQRAWGVPIPALYHKDTGVALLTPESVSHIVSIIQDRGIDAWWTDEEFDPVWTPPALRTGALYKRGRDTMDVWFDSGTSWTHMSLMEQNERAVADVYLEGTDQHRGWFQSSLLTKIASQATTKGETEFRAPFKTLITHGFTLDQAGKKMSKSEGNVISPDQIMDGTLLPPIKRKKINDHRAANLPILHDAMGPDALRLWAAGSDYTKDVVVGEPVLKAVNNNLSKLRVTFKLLLGLLETYDPQRRVEFGQLGAIDQIALIQLKRVTTGVREAFQSFEYHKAIGTINQYINTDFSAFYIESIKDRLYADATNSKSRVHAQIVLWEIYKHLASILAPITPLLVEEARDYLPERLIFHPVKQAWSNKGTIQSCIDGDWENPHLEANMPYLFAANAALKAAQELARTDKKMGSSLQSFAVLEFGSSDQGAEGQFERALKSHQADLEDLFVVSKVELGTSAPLSESAWSYSADCSVQGEELVAHVLAPSMDKCDRCWRYAVPRPTELEEALCQRCIGVLEGEHADLFEGKPNLVVTAAACRHGDFVSKRLAEHWDL